MVSPEGKRRQLQDEVLGAVALKLTAPSGQDWLCPHVAHHEALSANRMTWKSVYEVLKDDAAGPRHEREATSVERRW